MKAWIPCIIHFNLSILTLATLSCQNYPWERPLKIAWSNDGKIFGNAEIYQDSSGVPCVIRWKGDTLICAFQWFREPKNSPSWDRVAVKFSYDNGLSWTQPTPIIINNMPSSYQRAFDPALTVFGGDSIRIYFSSSSTIPKMGSDSIINTYSAKSMDGIHYVFEPDARVDEPANRVIDPSVIYFNKSWHYAAPIGSPQQGAYHYVSPDGIHFSSVPNIPSDNMHNWTGNYMIYDSSELRFYGSGSSIWFNSTSNGGKWNEFIYTNVQGGDPSVVKLSDQNYLMIYVGNPYPVASSEFASDLQKINIKINSLNDGITIHTDLTDAPLRYQIYTTLSTLISKGIVKNNNIRINQLYPGIYFLIVQSDNFLIQSLPIKFIKN